MSLVEINKSNFYCWLFIDYSNSGEGQTLNKKQWIYDYDFNKMDITDDNYSISSISYSIVDYNTSQVEEQLASFIGIFQIGQQFLEKNEFVQTYELAKNKPDIKTIIFNTDNKSNNETEIASKDTAKKETSSNQKLNEVVQIGDYVNYMNSDTFWRVLNVTDKGSVILICFTGTETYDNHGDGSYIYSLYEKEANKYKTEYSKSTSFVPHFNWIKESYKKTHDVDITISSKLEGDLYNIGLDYYTVEADMKEYESRTTYITMDGKVLSNYLSLGNCYLRPTITLKTDVKTTGKNEKGAWILTN